MHNGKRQKVTHSSVLISVEVRKSEQFVSSEWMDMLVGSEVMKYWP